jgi:signal transduction histidine kinase
MTMEQPRDVWEKWEWLWTAIFYLTVLGSTIFMLLDSSRMVSAWTAGLLTAFLLLWHWSGFRLAYRDAAAWEQRTIARFILIIGDAILWFVLVNISPAYYLALFGLFGQVFRHLPVHYAAVAAILLTVATVIEQLTDSSDTFTLANPTLWLFFFMGLGAIVLGIWVSAIIEQSTRRRELIEQLEATRAELAAAERREGVLEERQRLAREIHDTLAQGFTSIVMHLEAAEQALPGDPDKLHKHLDKARSTARASLDQARRVVQDLRPELLEQQSLPEAIQRTAQRWKDESGIPVTTTITGNPLPLHPIILR